MEKGWSRRAVNSWPFQGMHRLRLTPSPQETTSWQKWAKPLCEMGMNRYIFHSQPTENKERGNQRTTSGDLKVAMMIFWNQHWLILILTLFPIDLVSATVPVITLAGTSLIKTSTLLCTPEKNPKLTCCSKFLGFRIPLSKRESAQPFKRRRNKVLHKTHQAHHCHGRRPWMFCLSLELIPSHNKKCSHLGKLVRSCMKFLLCISNTVLCAQSLQ